MWFILLFLFAGSAYGQKVKYKDIFALLSTKQYEQAEPFLKRYIKDNDDNPNAYLYLGIIFQEKAMKTDILKQTSMAIANMDSSILYYDKATKIMDDREVRRNKEYYQVYNRRDLRTGEFGVKLSDIQFDIEKKIEGLRERIDKVKMVKHYFSLGDSLYQRAHRSFNTIQKKYPSERQLYLRADEGVVNSLKVLSVKFDSCMKAFENYKTSSGNLGKTGYNQVFTPVEIVNWDRDGYEPADFYKEEPKMWDYKKFADKSLNIIEKEIFPMRDHLIAYDVEINKLRDKLNTDSASVSSDLTKLIDRLLYDQLIKYDPNPLPMDVFSLKTADLEYRSALIENKSLGDTADVHLKLRMTRKEINLLNKLDSIAGKLTQDNIDLKAQDYSHFVANTYSSPVVLKSYVKALKEYSEREKRKKTIQLTARTKALDWIVDSPDSIPLRLFNPKSRYKPLFTADEKYTLGLHFIDSLNSEGYFYTITPGRKPEVKVLFPVDKPAFKERKSLNSKALSYADAGGQIYFVLLYSEQPNKDKYSSSLAKIYRSDGLAWSYNYQLTFIPKEILFKPDIGEVTVKNDTHQVVIDKNGKVVKQ
jgi:tetratricopeptide (TPR) repeat protein